MPQKIFTRWSIVAGCILLVVVSILLYSRQHHQIVPPVCGQATLQSHRSYCISSTPATYTPQTPVKYSFIIFDDQGRVVKDFATTHTKLMHVIVVRNDLQYFQHVHPDYDPQTGVFTIDNLVFPANGTYRIFADFAVQNGMKDMMGMPLGVTVFQDVSVGDVRTVTPVLLGDETHTKTYGDLTVTLTTQGSPKDNIEHMLMFSLSRNGRSVRDLEQYLGALGHAVILREGTLDFIHAHPVAMEAQNGTIPFMVSFPEPGRYKVFTQFQRKGKILTTDFIVDVIPRTDGALPAHPMNHSMH